MYSSLQEQVGIVSNSLPLPDTNGNMDASELLKEKVPKDFLTVDVLLNSSALSA